VQPARRSLPGWRRIAARHDHVGSAEHRELLRHVARLDANGVDQLVNGVVMLAEKFEDPDPGGVAEGSEELCLGLVKGDWHDVLLAIGRPVQFRICKDLQSHAPM